MPCPERGESGLLSGKFRGSDYIMASMISLQVCESREEWDGYVLENGGHPLQLWGWGEVKAAYGWRVERVFAVDMDRQIIGGAQVLVKSLSWPLRAMAYVPRGPVADAEHAPGLLEALGSYVRSQYRAVALSIEPDWAEVPPLLGKNWKHAERGILTPHTLRFDLGKTQDELLASLTKTARQHISQSSGGDLAVRQVKGREYLAACLDIYHETAKRDGFAVHSDRYYHDAFAKLGEFSPVFVTFHDEQPVAFIWLAISAETAFELYAGVTDRGQELHADDVLRWHVIRKVLGWGIAHYDANGVKPGTSDREDALVGTYNRPLSAWYPIWVLLPPGR